MSRSETKRMKVIVVKSRMIHGTFVNRSPRSRAIEVFWAFGGTTRSLVLRNTIRKNTIDCGERGGNINAIRRQPVCTKVRVEVLYVRRREQLGRRRSGISIGSGALLI